MMSIKLYNNLFSQAIKKIRIICSPHSPRINNEELGWSVVEKQICFDFGGSSFSNKQSIIESAKRVSISCLQFVLCELFNEYGYQVEKRVDFDNESSGKKIDGDLSPALFVIQENNANTLLVFKEIEKENVFLSDKFISEEIKTMMIECKASSCKFVYLMWDCAYMQFIGHDKDSTDPGRGYNRYGLKWVFDTYFNLEEYGIFETCLREYIHEVNDLIGHIFVRTLSKNALANYNRINESKLVSFNYQELLNIKTKNYSISDSDWNMIFDQFYNKKYYYLLRGSRPFAESFVTAEWLYDSMKSAGIIDLTVIGTGYFKCVEQLLFDLVCLHKNKGLTIHRINSKKSDTVELSDDTIKNNEIDATIGSLAAFCGAKKNGIFLNNRIRNYIVESVRSYSKSLRNGYLHKENIHNWEKIDEIRTRTYYMLFLLIGGSVLESDQLPELGYPDIRKLTDYYYLCEYFNYHSNELFIFETTDGRIIHVIGVADEDSYVDKDGFTCYSDIRFKIYNINKSGLPKTDGRIYRVKESGLPKKISIVKLHFSQTKDSEIKIDSSVTTVFENGKFIGPKLSEELKDF